MSKNDQVAIVYEVVRKVLLSELFFFFSRQFVVFSCPETHLDTRPKTYHTIFHIVTDNDGEEPIFPASTNQ